MQRTIEERMKACGFNIEETGGGCTAYVRRDGEVEEFVTVIGLPQAPTRLKDEVDVGFTVDGGELNEVPGNYNLQEVLAALENPSDEYYLLDLRLQNGLHVAR